MKKNLYVIYDKVAEESGPIFEAINDGVAVRNFAGMLRNDIPKSLHDDYTLYRIGEVDSKSMAVSGSLAVEINMEYAIAKMEAENE